MATPSLSTVTNSEQLQKFDELLKRLLAQKNIHLKQAIIYRDKMKENFQKKDNKALSDRARKLASNNYELDKQKMKKALEMAKYFHQQYNQQYQIKLNYEKASKDPKFREKWLEDITAAVSGLNNTSDRDSDSESDKEELSESQKEELEELSEEPIQCSRRSPSRSRTASNNATLYGKLWLKNLWSKMCCSSGGGTGKNTKKYKKYNKKTRRVKKYKNTKKRKNKFLNKKTRSKKY